MNIERKIFTGFLFIFTLVFVLSAWAYFAHFETTLSAHQRIQAGVVNANVYNDLQNTLANNASALKSLEGDGDIALAYDTVPWLSVVGVGKLKRNFQRTFENYPYINAVSFYKNNALLVKLANEKPSLEAAIFEASLDLGMQGSRVAVETDMTLFLQRQLAQNRIRGLRYLTLEKDDAMWLITPKGYARYGGDEIKKDKAFSLGEQKLVSSACARVENTGYCLKSLISHEYYYDALKSLIVRTVALYIGVALVMCFVARYLSVLIMQPIKTLEHATKRYTEGDFSPIELKSEGEIAIAIAAFNTMGHRIKNFTGELQEEVRLRTQELTDANQKLTRLASTDALTGLYNRGKIDELIHMELERFRRFAHPFCIILMDLDDFKSINDTYGHQAGDIVLKEFAAILQTTTRKTDSAGRWGGEEFLVLSPGTTLTGAKTLAQTIIETLRQRTFAGAGKASVSIGVAQYRQGETYKDFFARVDRNLYTAKTTGKDRVVG
ncbi:MAG: diguanylate cyclase [Campylobacterales bacterium]|nr:diguanylate cyclase [Campylobacterales bacterium]